MKTLNALALVPCSRRALRAGQAADRQAERADHGLRHLPDHDQGLAGKVPGVSKVQVSYEKREAVIVYDDAQATVADLKKATEDVGYPSMLKTAR
jgi:cation transport ATPase